MAYGELQSVGLAQSVVEIVVTAPASGGLLDQGPYRRGMSELEARAAQLPRVRNTLSAPMSSRVTQESTRRSSQRLGP